MFIVYIALCIAHITLAALHIVHAVAAILLAVILALVTYKRVVLDPSAVVLIILLPLHVIGGIATSGIVLMACLFVVIYSTRMQQQKQRADAAALHVQQQLTHFNETFQHVRRERHDYLKHVAAISYMLERDEMDDVKAYMHTLIERYEETNLSIKGEQGAVASVLHTHYARAKQLGITLTYDLDVPISTIPVAPDELVQLVGNMLDNAVDAATQFQLQTHEHAYVALTLQKKSGLYVLTCINSTLPVPTNIADQLFEASGLTTKDGHSGLGTSIIAHIVQQHSGFLDFTAHKGTFTLTCKLPHIM